MSQARTAWRGIKICPLIPLLITQCPGTLAREILEIATWLEKSVYENNPAGLLATWTAVVAATEKCSEGATTLSAMDAYKIPMPVGLSSSAPVQSTTFCSSSTRPVTLQGLPKDILCELLNTLIKNIHGNFQTCASPESFLVRATSMLSTEPSGRKVVLIGASNLKNSARNFSSNGFEVQDLTVPGWVASHENIEILQSKLMRFQADSNTVFIFDLLGNSAYRFEQFDGTQSLPFKTNNKYHLAGNIVTCALPTFKKLVEGIIPIIAAKREAVGLIIPSLPRYLFSGCCDQKEHCRNITDPGHSRKLLSDIICLRNSLKKIVCSHGLANIRVLDSCCVTKCADTANTELRLAALRDVMSPDGVHYLSEGYGNLVDSCVTATDATVRKNETAPVNTGQPKHFWRGFRSPVGAKICVRSNNIRGNFTRGSNRGSNRGRPGRQFHPYRRN